jgi:hypothetical protein
VVHRLALIAALAALVAPDGAAALDGVDPAGRITAEDIRRHTVVLGSDAMEGRAPGSVGGDRAADYLVRDLEAAGVEPFGDDGGFRQRVPLHSSLPLPDSRLEIWNLGETRRLQLGEDYLLYTAGSQTWIPRRVPMVFVGYGIVAPEFDHNDYHGLDVRGKVVVYLAGEPQSDDPAYFQGQVPSVYATSETKQKIALARGAVGSLMVPLPRLGFDLAWRRATRDYAFESLGLAYSLPEHLSGVLHPNVVRWLFSDALHDFASVMAMEAGGSLQSFHMPTRMSFRGRFRERDLVASNIVGRIEGSEPELGSSAVVVVAHYDHLGVGPPVAGDAIYNGAVDNALGVSCVLEAAAHLAERPNPLRRPVIIVFTTAEEAGLLGARYFLDHPPIPPARMAAAINVDGLAFLHPFRDLIGIGGELSDLGVRLRRAVKPLGLEVSTPPDEIWDHVAYARGDQLAFAEAGVPSILVNEGFDWPGRTRDEALDTALAWMIERYHSPSDDLEQPIVYSAAALHCNAVLELVIAVADHPRPPSWHPEAPYAYERLLSIALDR